MNVDHIQPSAADRNNIERLAAEMTGSLEDGRRWMNTACMGLDGAIPKTLMRSSAGRERVAAFLLRVIHGVFV